MLGMNKIYLIVQVVVLSLAISGCKNDNELIDTQLKKIILLHGLTGDKDAACVSCHHPSLGGGDAISLSIGTGKTALYVVKSIGTDNSFILGTFQIDTANTSELASVDGFLLVRQP